MALSIKYAKTITVPDSSIDENGHVNNVTYVQWMHAESVSLLSIIHRLAASRRRDPMPRGRA